MLKRSLACRNIAGGQYAGRTFGDARKGVDFTAGEYTPYKYTRGEHDWHRVVKRRKEVEARRRLDAATYVPPQEPTAEQARQLYRAMLKAGRAQLRLTDPEFYRQKLRHEFEVTARRTTARVRGVMFEKGQWMLRNKLGGLV